MANEFIRTSFEDRHQRVNSAVSTNTTREIATGMDDLIDRINDGNEQRWQNLLRKIVNCVALVRKCDGHVGKYLNDHYQHWTQKKRNQLTANCTYSRKIFMKWDVIVTNLTKPKMSHVNPQLFSIRKLYDATSPSWCERERKQNGALVPKNTTMTVEQAYDEEKFLAIVNFTNASGIMRDISFDEDQLDHYLARYKTMLREYAESQ
jgi:hypothetical protein